MASILASNFLHLRIYFRFFGVNKCRGKENLNLKWIKWIMPNAKGRSIEQFIHFIPFKIKWIESGKLGNESMKVLKVSIHLKIILPSRWPSSIKNNHKNTSLAWMRKSRGGLCAFLLFLIRMFNDPQHPILASLLHNFSQSNG